MKIGILQTGRPPEQLLPKHGDYAQMFSRLLAGRGLTFESYAVLDGVFPASIEAADGWLITGSRHGVYERHDWIAPLEAFIRNSFAGGIPVVGICFGHQIMAQALGGKVEKFKGGWAVGNIEYAFRDAAPMQLMTWHQDQVIEPPAEAVPFAHTDFCRYAALSYGAKGLSLQAHPEFDDAFMRDLLATRGEILPGNIRMEAMETLSGPASASRAADLIASCFQSERALLV
jgi:GMP synthase-like glutamine amidotransferase